MKLWTSQVVETCVQLMTHLQRYHSCSPAKKSDVEGLEKELNQCFVGLREKLSELGTTGASAADTGPSPVCGSVAAGVRGQVLLPLSIIMSAKANMPVRVKEMSVRFLTDYVGTCGAYLVENDSVHSSQAAGPQEVTRLLYGLILIISELGVKDAQGTKSSTSAQAEGLLDACLMCVKAILRCAGEVSTPGSCLTQHVDALCLLWGEVKASLSAAYGGGLLAQLVQSSMDVAEGFGDGASRLSSLQLGRGLLELLSDDKKLWRSFFPGVFSALFKVLKGGGGARRREKEVEAALVMLHRLVVVCLASDKRPQAPPLPAAAEEEKPMHMLLHLAKQANANVGVAAAPLHLDAKDGSGDAWVAAAMEKLVVLMPPIATQCRHHPSWKVRLALSAMSQDVLLTCGESVKPIALVLLETLIGLQVDEQDAVSMSAAQGLELYRESLGALAWLTVRSSLVERALKGFQSLPSVALSANERNLRGSFNLLGGYLRLLGPDTLILLDAHSPALIACLCLAFELDPFQPLVTGMTLAPRATYSGSSASLSAELGNPEPICSSSSSGSSSSSSGRNNGEGAPSERAKLYSRYPRRIFSHIRDDATLQSAKKMLHALGRQGGGSSTSGRASFWAFVERLLRQVTTRPPEVLPRSGRRGARGGASEGESTLASGVQQRLLWLRKGQAVAYIIAELLRGVEGGSDSLDAFPEEQALAILDRVLHCTAWTLPTSLTPGEIKAPAEGGGLAKEAVAWRASSTQTLSKRQGRDEGGPGDENLASSSRDVLQGQATLTALLLEVVGTLKDWRRPASPLSEALLQQAIYPLLTKLADPHPFVRGAALVTLQVFASSQGSSGHFQGGGGKEDGVPRLLAQNMDYIVDAALLHMNSLGAVSSSRRARRRTGLMGSGDDALRVSAVLAAVLRYSDASAPTPVVHDLTTAVLRQVDSFKWDMNAEEPNLRVLSALVNATTMPVKEGDGEGGGHKSTEHPRGSSSRPLPPSSVHAHDEATAEADVPKDDAKRPQCLRKSEWFLQLCTECASPSDVLHVQERGEESVKRGAHPADKEDGDSSEAQEGEETADEKRERDICEAKEVKAIKEVLKRCCYMLATPRLRIQAMTLSVMRTCFQRLAETRVDTVLLTSVHQAWPSMLARFRDHASPVSLRGGGIHAEGSPPYHSRRGLVLATSGEEPLSEEGGESLDARKAVLLHLLLTLETLVELCGDFLSLKVTEELWPLLRVLLERNRAAIQRKRLSHSRERPGRGPGAIDEAEAQTTFPSQPFKGVDDKIVAALIRCVTALSESEACQRFMVPLARDAALLALPFITAASVGEARTEIVILATDLLQQLLRLDGDAVWLLLRQALGKDSARVGISSSVRALSLPDWINPPMTGGAGSSLGAGGEALIVQLLRTLQLQTEVF